MTFSGGKTVAACDSMHCGTAHGVRGIGKELKLTGSYSLLSR